MSAQPPGSAHDLIEEWDQDLRSADPLGFPDYAAKVASLEHQGGVATGHGPAFESVRTGRTSAYVLIENNFEVFGGSMGAVHGERVVRAFRRATDLRLPVVVLTRSGGARMQEGMLSLIQMARTAAAQRAHADAGLLSVAVFRSPTTGGVFASYGSLCDLRAVEEGAVIGFAGPRVAAEVTGVEVGERSHRAERAFEAGLVDALLPPGAWTSWVDAALGMASTPLLRSAPAAEPEVRGVEPSPSDGSAWAEVCAARGVGRPTGIDIAAKLCSSWTELRGTDPVTRAALATVDGRRVVVVAHDRFAGTGRPTPAGFRLAQRAVALAGRLGLPLVSLIDTPGAEPGWEAEQDGVAGEIARTFAAYAAVPTPTVAVCVGEGGSGGALALGAADVFLIQQHAVFSVIGPEGAAAILERDGSKAPVLAERLRLTSDALLALGVVDGVVPDDVDATTGRIRDALRRAVPGARASRLDAATLRAVRQV